MIQKTSGIVALICFISVALLPWFAITHPEVPDLRLLAMLLFWLVIGAAAVSVRDGSRNTQRRQRRGSDNGR